jgi:hypothetical protein
MYIHVPRRFNFNVVCESARRTAMHREKKSDESVVFSSQLSLAIFCHASPSTVITGGPKHLEHLQQMM